AALEMHPLDTEDRIEELRNTQGIGYCNITKCCTKVCPESIQITDNGIIPSKERVVDDFYDPLGWFWRLRKKLLNRYKSMSELRRLHKDAIPAALDKAELDRLLTESGETESIGLAL